jgi:hypothetical protein
MIDYKISRAEILLKELKSNERPLTNPEKNILENLF